MRQYLNSLLVEEPGKIKTLWHDEKLKLAAITQGAPTHSLAVVIVSGLCRPWIRLLVSSAFSGGLVLEQGLCLKPWPDPVRHRTTVVQAAASLQLRPGIWPRLHMERPVALDCPSLACSFTKDKEKPLRTNLHPSLDLKGGIHADSRWAVVFWQFDSLRRRLKKALFFAPQRNPWMVSFSFTKVSCYYLLAKECFQESPHWDGERPSDRVIK